MTVHAIVHTQGVVLGRHYHPLELAYADRLGHVAHLLIASPIRYSDMKRQYPRSFPDVLMSVEGGASYSSVLSFLQGRYRLLQRAYPSSDIVFGYKGQSYQSDILRDAGLSNTVNLESLGRMPRLDHRTRYHPYCPWHRGHSKCALDAVARILSFLRDSTTERSVAL